MTNYLDKKPNDEDYFCAKVYRDGNGNLFPDRNARYVIFNGQELVGEFASLQLAKMAFNRQERVDGGIRLRDYKGLNR